ncbi:integration host factor subunit alpha [Devosia pacifica]|uniref:Integration host factor subunit alpha n=1 Tax=Devosia pacifica TaxID=1335967 RepID=A0A918VT32_9HYPH|nr:HU family DNA-binding protein [Devosia pacifica]GHA20560.1 integration host factor subunit alpha [Devosia pacifica]
MSNTLTRAQIHRRSAARTGQPQAVTEEIATRMIELMGETLSQGDNVKMTGFGTLEVRARGARVGRNPRTGEVHPVQARRVVVFTPSAKLRDRLDGLEPNGCPDDEFED